MAEFMCLSICNLVLFYSPLKFKWGCHRLMCTCRQLLDKIKTSCRLLLGIANGESDRPSLSYWLGACAVLLFIQLYPAADADAFQTKANLKQLAQHLQVCLTTTHCMSRFYASGAVYVTASCTC